MPADDERTAQVQAILNRTATTPIPLDIRVSMAAYGNAFRVQQALQAQADPVNLLMSRPSSSIGGAASPSFGETLNTGMTLWANFMVDVANKSAPYVLRPPNPRGATFTGPRISNVAAPTRPPVQAGNVTVNFAQQGPRPVNLANNAPSLTMRAPASFGPVEAGAPVRFTPISPNYLPGGGLYRSDVSFSLQPYYFGRAFDSPTYPHQPLNLPADQITLRNQLAADAVDVRRAAESGVPLANALTPEQISRLNTAAGGVAYDAGGYPVVPPGWANIRQATPQESAAMYQAYLDSRRNDPLPPPLPVPTPFAPVDPGGGVDADEDWGKDDSDQAAVVYASSDSGGGASGPNLTIT